MCDLLKIVDSLVADVGSRVLEVGDDPGVGILEGRKQITLGIELALPPVFHLIAKI